ncbi:hypothetical protein CMI37_07550 [Candidatus Pacearchaeota archaeon]|nr:hypothetical protein [Candidatus Pacearchaeota archaeon]
MAAAPSNLRKAPGRNNWRSGAILASEASRRVGALDNRECRRPGALIVPGPSKGKGGRMRWRNP